MVPESPLKGARGTLKIPAPLAVLGVQPPTCTLLQQMGRESCCFWRCHRLTDLVAPSTDEETEAQRGRVSFLRHTATWCKDRVLGLTSTSQRPGRTRLFGHGGGPSLELGALENFRALTSNSPSPAVRDAARRGGPGRGQQKPAVKGSNAQKMWLSEVGGGRPGGRGGGFP